MHLDVVLPPRTPGVAGREAELAEHRGFGALWASEVRSDPFLTLGVAAGTTRRIELGTAIAVAFARNPMSTAAVADDLQALSGGRLLLGLGTQVRAHVTRRFSMPWSRPAARMREYVLALRAIWSAWHDETPLDFAGEFYTHTLMTPVFVPEPHGHGAPPVFVAGVGKAMTRVAGEVADGFVCHGFTTGKYLREITLPALARGRAEPGAPASSPVVVGGPMIATGRDDAEIAAAIRRVRGQVAFYASTPAYRPVLDLHGWGDLGTELHALTRAGRWTELPGLISDDVFDEFAVAGPPAQVGSEMHARFAGVVDRVSLSLDADAAPELFEEIADAFRSTGEERT
ncbi:TIGR03617 family F420-dependent LLM class oxidoreductase [Pseudonocardia sp. KRD291]|uniref:TIGR03617 family F420-dependent LLM class oxidoreductase n=1 Tax=Pseudonocardia sp. KRD291 TaxID=2792007 RepID=UPI001C4A111D|nr:TIGR03617 family F420-dependent LLM class oxidoreductase [Pseudonocardia sp. KRD291]MBW0106376.1 TIGR03617 family F420-dependent LLM class oxidoreductase [Pseudonocardia sp. KRD291]MDN5915323.1 TIGR03617 family F420-dependent LLM class oxidoreductase [Pseudonocardia sp.]